MTGQNLFVSAILVAIAGIGGCVAQPIGAPMPFMLGGLTAVAALVLFRPGVLPDGYKFPEPIRRMFIALVGALIGATFTPELIQSLTTIWISFLFILLFIVLVQSLNFVIYRKIGGYDPVTAFYASMPGGLVEATVLGEAAGGDARLLTIQHFLRVILTIVIVPLLFLIISGEPVGSSAGMQFQAEAPRNADILVIFGIAVIGLLLGNFIPLPAKQFVLPLFLSAALHVSGVVDTATPIWLIGLAQVVVGASLGARFAGVNRGMLFRALGLGILSVSAMLLIGAMCALIVAGLVNQPREVVFISFAPGGVTEMSLIALSLAANPAFVSAHHVLRITVTVLISTRLARWFGVGNG